jgi:hypothetical protein
LFLTYTDWLSYIRRRTVHYCSVFS